MYFFLDFLLLALFAAAAVDAALALARTRSPRAALALVWDNPHWLFGGFAQPLRERLAQPVFLAAVALYELEVCLCNSLLRYKLAFLGSLGSSVLDGIVLAFLGVKILLCTRYSWKNLACAGACLFIFRWVFLNCQDIWFIGLFLFVFAFKDQLLVPALRAYSITGGLCVGLVVLLSQVGFLDNITTDWVGRPRSAFGYGHPNTLGGLVLGVICGFALLRGARMRWHDWLAMGVTFVFLMVGPNSRSSAMGVLMLMCVLAVAKLLPKLTAGRPVHALVLAAPPLLCLGSYTLPRLLVYYDNNVFGGPAWLLKLNELSTGRVEMICYQFMWNKIPFKIAGQTMPEWPVLDDSYVAAFYNYGPVVALLMLAALMFTLWRQLKKGQIHLALCLCVMMLYAAMEVQFFHFTTNPAILLCTAALFLQPDEQDMTLSGTRGEPPAEKYA